MSELKASDLTAEHFNKLTPTKVELLALLSEECGEVVQVVGKILRHGLSSCHPDGGPPNYRLLESEIGDLIAATRLIASAGMIDMVRVEDAADEKLRRVFKYLHHSPAQPEPKREVCPRCHQPGDHYHSGDMPHVPAYYTCQPAPSPAPVAAGELPEAVSNAARIMRFVASTPAVSDNDTEALLCRADALESWARSQATAQPVAVGMTPELERVISLAEEQLESAQLEGAEPWHETEHENYVERGNLAIAAVRAQAASAQPGRDLPKVREFIQLVRNRLESGGRFLAHYEIGDLGRYSDAALAELDAQPKAGHASRDEEVKAKDERIENFSHSLVAAIERAIGAETEIAALRQRVAEANEVIVHFTRMIGDRILDRECHTLLLDSEMTNAIIQAHNKESNV